MSIARLIINLTYKSAICCVFMRLITNICVYMYI